MNSKDLFKIEARIKANHKTCKVAFTMDSGFSSTVMISEDVVCYLGLQIDFGKRCVFQSSSGHFIDTFMFQGQIIIKDFGKFNVPCYTFIGCRENLMGIGFPHFIELLQQQLSNSLEIETQKKEIIVKEVIKKIVKGKDRIVLIDYEKNLKNYSDIAKGEDSALMEKLLEKQPLAEYFEYLTYYIFKTKLGLDTYRDLQKIFGKTQPDGRIIQKKLNNRFDFLYDCKTSFHPYRFPTDDYRAIKEYIIRYIDFLWKENLPTQIFKAFIIIAHTFTKGTITKANKLSKKTGIQIILLKAETLFSIMKEHEQKNEKFDSEILLQLQNIDNLE